MCFHAQVANASVRANAAALLMDAFPLQDPESSKEDSDALTQKQFDILQVGSPMQRIGEELGWC